MRRWLLALCLCACNQFYDIENTRGTSDSPRALVFDNSDSRSDLTNFVAPVFLDPSRIAYKDVADPKTDLRFFDPETSTNLPFEVESWVPGDRSLVWVRVPTITAGKTDQQILMYYGKDANGSEDPASVWADYEVVVHGMPDRFQSASRPITPLITGPTISPTGTGPLGPNLKFADDQYIELEGTTDLFAGWPQFTLELWIYAAVDMIPPTDPGPQYEPVFIDQWPTFSKGRFIDGNVSLSDYAQIQIDTTFENPPPNGTTAFKGVIAPLRRWVHLAYTFDETGLYILRNGALEDGDPDYGGNVTTAAGGNLMLGYRDQGMPGQLDEIRVSRQSRSVDWIAAEFLAMKGGFVSFAGTARPQ